MRLALLWRIVIITLVPFAAEIKSAVDDSDLSAPVGIEEDGFRNPVISHHEQLDTVFIDIKMTAGEVIAQDSYGNWWQYDFNTAEFIPYQLPERTEPAAESVETRCIRQKITLPFSEKNILVGYEEFVNGNVIAFGKIVVAGWVQGDVKSINGDVIVNSTGQVDGDISAKQVDIKEGGIVSGRTEATQGFDLPWEQVADHGLLIAMISAGIIFLASFIILSLMPAQLINFSACMMRYRLRSVLVGLFSVIIILPICTAAFLFSVILWVVVPFVPLLGLVAVSMGLVSWSNNFGSWFLSGFRKHSGSPILPSLIGLTALSILWIGSVLLAMVDNPITRASGVVLLFLTLILTAYPALAGLGTALLTRFGFRAYVSFGDSVREEISAPDPAPPPIPESPPVFPHSQATGSSDFKSTRGEGPLSSESE